MEKPKNLYVQPMDINYGWEYWWEWGDRAEGNKGEKKMEQL